MAARVGKGKAVHALHDSGNTLCGAEYGKGTRNGKVSTQLHHTDAEVTCRNCTKTKTVRKAPAKVATNYGPNARENFTLLADSATTVAGARFWLLKLNEMGV